jgi:hypothetical protein
LIGEAAQGARTGDSHLFNSNATHLNLALASLIDSYACLTFWHPNSPALE